MDSRFLLPPPVRQLYVHRMLVGARKTILHDVLLAALGEVDPDVLSAEIQRYGPKAARQVLQRVGVRNELVFATPAVIRQRPSTLGYYRLLLGISQRIFYTTDTGLAPFKILETGNHLPGDLESQLGDLCETLDDALGVLVMSLADSFTSHDIDQLPLLMLGAQADGSWRNRVGQKATKDVFEALVDVIKGQRREYVEAGGSSLALVNSSGREVSIALAADPDVVITEEITKGRKYIKVAIEIKGGADKSNAHNRVGEAEKSHQKVRNIAQDFWTVISLTGMDMDMLHRESPSTKQWFDLRQVLERRGPDWERLSDHLLIAMGI
jgi:hypothetical protein